jgi:cytochrome P450
MDDGGARMSAATLPRADDIAGLGADPMRWLADGRTRLGDLYALPAEGPLLSNEADCSGVVAVFGEAHQRAVLGDIERFVLPTSAALRLGLPPALARLNASLHGLRGERHAREKALLARALNTVDDVRLAAIAEAAVASVDAALSGDAPWPLLATMRAIARRAGTALLFGDTAIDGFTTDALMTYFQLRREAAAPWADHDAAAHAHLIESGERVDAGLRAYRRAVRAARGGGDFGLLGTLAADDALDEDTFVAHANVQFISSNEPVAVALTWTLLALSQLPGLRGRLRAADAAHDVGLADAVLAESLRVLTPNALMVRIARVPVRVGAHRLPAHTEVLLCPFLSHRDPVLFPEPTQFRPSRWAGLRPSGYAYFPFGAGGHGCVGRSLALRTLRAVTTALRRRGDAVLVDDTAIDWRVHVMLMPTIDPSMRMRTTTEAGGALRGGVAEIVALSDEWC